MVSERGLPSSRWQLGGSSLHTQGKVGALSPAGVMVTHGSAPCRLWDDTIKSPQPDTSQGCLSSSSIHAPAQRNGNYRAFGCVGTHPKEAPTAAVLGPAQASCSLRAMWGLDAKAQGFRHCQRAGGGAASSMGLCGEHGGRGGEGESPDSCHTPATARSSHYSLCHRHITRQLAPI